MTSSLKILAVDDDAMICNVYKMIFGEEGYDLTVVESGRQAKEMLSEKRFDLVIADFNMPDLDGFKLLQFVRDRRLKTRFILVSAYTTKGMELSFQKLRAEAVIHKPFNVSEMLAKVREVAGQEPFNPFQTSVAR
ncbi:MAG: response regulator [Chloroherpetonaceae bacterium]